MEVESGAGSHAPRKRQAYASKRLQQVVSDFRKERAKIQGQSTGSPAPSQDGDFAPEDETRPPKKRRRTTALKSLSGKTRLKKARGRRKDAGPGSTGEESMDDAENLPAGLIPSRPLSVQLRPRPEPDKKMDADLAEHSSSSSDQNC